MPFDTIGLVVYTANHHFRNLLNSLIFSTLLFHAFFNDYASGIEPRLI